MREDDGMVALNVKQPHLTIPALLDAIDKQGSQLQHLTTRQASLEDVFVRLTGRHLRRRVRSLNFMSVAQEIADRE